MADTEHIALAFPPSLTLQHSQPHAKVHSLDTRIADAPGARSPPPRPLLLSTSFQRDAMTATPTLSNNSSSSTRTAASSSSSSNNNNNHGRANANTNTNPKVNASGNSDPAHTDCYYCAHLKLLRDVIPPKRCDYVRTHTASFAPFRSIAPHHRIASRTCGLAC